MVVAGAVTKPVLFVGSVVAKPLMFAGQKAFNSSAKFLGLSGAKEAKVAANAATKTTTNAGKAEEVLFSRSGAGEKSFLHQFNLSIDPKIQTPLPAEIYHGYADLTSRQSKLLVELSKPGKFVTINKSGINVTDLAALTAKTRDEFAMFTLGSRRMVFRGNNDMTPISKLNFDKLKNEGWTWPAHTHPGTSNTTLLSSGGDRSVLMHIDQEQSLILNSSGRRSIFNSEGNHIDISNNINKIGGPQ